MRPSLACAFSLVCLSVIGEEAPLDLVPKLLKGQIWKVEQTIEVKAQMPKRAGGPAAERPRVSNPLVLKEAWSDTAIEELGTGAGSVKRTWTEAKVGPEPSTLNGAELLVASAEKDRSTVTVRKGKPSEEALTGLSRAPVEPVTLLRAGREIKAGETWKVPAVTVAALLRGLASGFGAAAPVPKGQSSGLQQFLKGDGEAPWVCELTAVVKEGSKKGELIIELAGQRGDGAATTEAKGSLTFDGTRRRPVALTFSLTRSLRANDETDTDGFTETWTITRNWK